MHDLILTLAMKAINKQLKKFYTMYSKDQDSALEYLRSLALDNPFLYTPLGIFFYRRKILIEAEMMFRKAISHDKFDFVAYYFLGKTLEELDKSDEAFSMYEMAFMIFPWDVDIQEDYYRMKQKASAKETEEQEESKDEEQESQIKELFSNPDEILKELESKLDIKFEKK